MTLSPNDGKLFFELMWKLQYYVNQKRSFHKNISSLEEYADTSTPSVSISPSSATLSIEGFSCIVCL